MENSSDLDKKFEEAYKYVDKHKDSTMKLSNTEKLEFYALWKMAVNGECKSMLSFL